MPRVCAAVAVPGSRPAPSGARSCRSHRKSLPTTVVVNAAEGEPGTYKDRLLLERNPYAVLEGAMIAAHVAGARTITVATKHSFPQVARLREAIAEVSQASWNPGFEFVVVEGPREYLYGEETALLEVIDGRPPFPRIAPPWRRGLVDVVDDVDQLEDVEAGSGLSAEVELGGDSADNLVPPVLVNNVETFANVAMIIAKGASWFRSVGTAKTAGTLLCTVTGAVARPGVYEVPAGRRCATCWRWRHHRTHRDSFCSVSRTRS